MISQDAPGTRDSSPYPRRFCRAPERNRRIARPLRLITRVKRLDEDLLDQIGRRLYARDEPGADLVRAMRADAGTERVTMAQFKKALDEGIDAVREAPPALVRFFSLVDQVPPWVDFALIEHGAQLLRRTGRARADVLLQLALIGGYRFGGPPELLVATGGLSGSATMRRLGETEAWTYSVMMPGAMRRFGEGFKNTVHVRAMHALINDRFETNGRWDSEEWGLPINQTDQAATLGLFNSTLLLGLRALGWQMSTAESRAVMHLWRYVGWLMGVDEDWLFDTEREQNIFNYHVLMAQDDQTPAGAELAVSILEEHTKPDGGKLAKLRAGYEWVRLLGMLRYFLGKESMQGLHLPVVLPWLVPPIVVRNLVASLLVARTERGRRLLERTERTQKRMRKLFNGQREQVAALPT
ncbi:DUF2236 domain-containing protein [Saccharopolyspora sp. HNM0983]|uniref:DUF2236 domain-containing protein n=1 Tax=Saccharopolyspora montiporae TaxID=2781240 RepID=A0A929G221_9PSEU|nr:oxygenase MpaB family protein [Saccharopolyspora sp. HNM0983]MBE9376432.1 DUF2236 domain-containing protein [Saccharopolyspora sp. HNM0983]